MRLVLALSVVLIFTAGGCEQSGVPSDVTPSVTDSKALLFENAAPDLGIEFTDLPGDLDEFPLSAVMGSGCAICDFDRNGLLDLLFVAQSSTNANAALFSQEAPGRFSNQTERVGIAGMSGTGLAVADCNNDGWPDIYVTSTSSDTLWLNDAGKSFQNITPSCGLNNVRWGTAACWLDYDRDGWLDLFVTNYVSYHNRPCTRLGGGDRDFCSPVLFERTPDILYRNTTGDSANGEVLFEDVSVTTGISNGQTAGLGVTSADFTGDGLADIYVASDQHPNVLWIAKDGHFFDEAPVRGCDLDFQGNPQASMGIAIGSLQQTDRLDLVVAHLDGESHAVYQPGPGNLFVDTCRETGVASATRPLTGFGIAIQDFDGDGRNEIITANGRVRRKGPLPASREQFWQPYQQSLQLLKLDTAGSVYHGQSIDSRQHVARGLSTGDLDRDGDVDVAITTIGEPAIVLRNRQTSLQQWLTVKFIDPALGRRSCPGTEALILFGNESRRVLLQPCQSYASTHADEITIAMPTGISSFEVQVFWPHGSTAKEVFQFEYVRGQSIQIERGTGRVAE